MRKFSNLNFAAEKVELWYQAFCEELLNHRFADSDIVCESVKTRINSW